MDFNDGLTEPVSSKTFFVSGGEPLLVSEFCDAIRSSAVKSGAEERLVFEATSREDWSEIEGEMNSPSLFSTGRLIEIRLSGKVTKDGESMLKRIVGRSNNDDVYLIRSGELDSKTKKSNWYKSVSESATIKTFNRVPSDQLPIWISSRFASKGKKVSREAANLIADRTEGNLLATAQEIEKLCLTIESGNVTLAKVIESVSNGARFGIYDFRDSFLKGETSRALHIIKVLRDTGVEPLVIIWILKKELRDLAEVAFRKKDGENLNTLLRALRIWGVRVELIKMALKRRGTDEWLELLIEVANIGLIVKGVVSGEPWDSLELITIKACKGFPR